MESSRPSGRHDWMSLALFAFKNGDNAQKMAVCDDICIRFRSGAILHNNQPSPLEAITCIGEGLRTQFRILFTEGTQKVLNALVSSFVSTESVQEKDFFMRLLGATLIGRDRNLWIAKNVSKLFGSLKTICLTPNKGLMAMPIVGNILMQLFRSYNQSCSNFLNSCLESALITLNLQENDEMMFQRCLSKALERADFSLFIELPIALTALTICLEASSVSLNTLRKGYVRGYRLLLQRPDRGFPSSDTMGDRKLFLFYSTFVYIVEESRCE
ncbi:hypothetical protein M514_24476 [Trichuris suis]|uniref:Uncharacterized protein n=1 Tax=Trichuris suis TaxID=68888 RepID=A0A085N1F0_9BILA|nr:hypothetical protein M514_24476 [Trichuris suis]